MENNKTAIACLNNLAKFHTYMVNENGEKIEGKDLVKVASL